MFIHSRVWPMLLLILCLALSCDNDTKGKDDEPRLPENPTESPSYPSSAIKVVEQSLAQDIIVKAEEVTSVTLTYSAEITIAKPEHITLNDKVASGAAADGSTLTIPLTLQPASHYTLIVKNDALSASEGKSVTTFTLNFHTRATINIDNVATSPCTKNPTKELCSLYDRLRSVYGSKTFSGITESRIDDNSFSSLVHSTTQRYPAICCYNFDNIHTTDYSDITAVNAHHDNGGIVSLKWTWLVPANENATADTYSADNNFSISNALIKGHWENDFIEEDLDIVASHLQRLKDAGISVLINPMPVAQNHWWSKMGAPHFHELWKLVYDRLVVKHKLNNLIWVWTTDTTSLSTDELNEWYPGNEYVDIIGTEIYADSTAPQTELFLLLNGTFEGRKMIAITECGNIPDIKACHTAGDTWLYFIVSNTPTLNSTYTLNTPTHWSYILNSPFTISIQ